MKVEVVVKVATLKNSCHLNIDLKIILKTLRSILFIIDSEKKLILFFSKYFSTVNDVGILCLFKLVGLIESTH